MMEFSEPIEKYVLLSTGHDGRTCVRILLTPVRVVCQNTLTLALQEGEQVAQAYHTPSLQKQLDAAGRKLKALNSGFEKMAAAFRAMRGVPIDEEGVAQYMKKVFPDPETPTPGRWAARTESTRTACIQLFHDGMGNGDPEAKGTLWAAYNGVTEYVDHWRPAVGRERMFTVCFGRGYQVKTRAFRTACEMAGCTWQN
jgi:phage/plasmid-like protein (TIGR03299 family)